MGQESSTRCLFTGVPAEKQKIGNGTIFDSEACGRYVVSRLAERELTTSNGTSQGLINCAHKCLEIEREHGGRLIAYWTVGEASGSEREELLKKNMLPVRLNDFFSEPVNHAEKPFLLLGEFARNLSSTKPFAKFTASLRDQIWARINDESELYQMISFLSSRGLIRTDPVTKTHSSFLPRIYELGIQMEVDGWDFIRSRNQGIQSNKVFIATKFNWEPGEENLWLDIMDAIKRACLDCGYVADFVGQNHTGFITDRIIADIKRARFVVAELTYNNRGVYFESGFARGLDIPVFHVIKNDHVNGTDNEGKKVHFDIQQVRYLSWQTPQELHRDLKHWIEATVGVKK